MPLEASIRLEKKKNSVNREQIIPRLPNEYGVIDFRLLKIEQFTYRNTI